MSWESISLAEAFRPLKSSPFTRDELNYSGGQYQNVHYGDILVRFPSVVAADKEGLPFVNESSEGRCSHCSLLQNGDIIIADTAEDEAVGKAIEIQGIEEQKIVSGLHTMAFRPQEGMFAPGFLGYFLNSSVYHNQLLPLMQGIKVLSISKTAIGDTVIKYPSFDEQKKIVSALSGVDDMIGALDEAIAKRRHIKEGLMQQLLTGKTRLPGFSGEWKERRMDSFEIINGSMLKSSEYETGNVPVIAGGQTPAGFHSIANRPANTITISGSGAYAGFVSFHTIPIFASDCSTINNPKNVDIIYLYFCLLSKQNEIYKCQAGGAQPHVHAKDIKDITIMVPSSVEEQKAISSVLTKSDDEIKGLEAQRDKYTLIKQGMMQELLTGKTRLI